MGSFAKKGSPFLKKGNADKSCSSSPDPLRYKGIELPPVLSETKKKKKKKEERKAICAFFSLCSTGVRESGEKERNGTCPKLF